MQRATRIVVLVSILALGFWLRARHVDSHGLWLDELGTLWTIRTDTAAECTDRVWAIQGQRFVSDSRFRLGPLAALLSKLVEGVDHLADRLPVIVTVEFRWRATVGEDVLDSSAAASAVGVAVPITAPEGGCDRLSGPCPPGRVLVVGQPVRGPDALRCYFSGAVESGGSVAASPPWTIPYGL